MNLARRNVVLLVVAVGLAVPTTMRLIADAETFVDVSRIPLLFDGFTPDNVGSIALGQPKAEQPPPNPQNPAQKPPLQYDQVSLVRTDKGWALGQNMGDLAGAPASKQKVESDVFSHLTRIRNDREALVQANATPEQLVQYGLDEAHATLLKVNDRENKVVVAELLIGRDAAGALTGSEAVKGVFVRKSGSNDVVLYEFEKAWIRSVQAEPWLDKVLLKLEPEKVQRLSLRNAATGGKALTLEKKDGKASWVCAEPPPGRGAVRQSEVEAFVQRLRWITVQDYRMPMARVSNLATLGLQPAQIELELSYRDSAAGNTDAVKTVKFSVGNKVEDKTEYYMTSSETPFLMTWPGALVTAFELPPAESWFDPAAPAEANKPQDGGGDEGKKDGGK